MLYRAKHEGHHHAVKGGISKRQVLNGSLGQADRHSCLPHTLSRIGQHGCVRFNRFHPLDLLWTVPGKVQSSSRSHLLSLVGFSSSSLQSSLRSEEHTS